MRYLGHRNAGKKFLSSIIYSVSSIELIQLSMRLNWKVDCRDHLSLNKSKLHFCFGFLYDGYGAINVQLWAARSREESGSFAAKEKVHKTA